MSKRRREGKRSKMTCPTRRSVPTKKRSKGDLISPWPIPQLSSYFITPERTLYQRTHPVSHRSSPTPNTTASRAPHVSRNAFHSLLLCHPILSTHLPKIHSKPYQKPTPYDIIHRELKQKIAATPNLIISYSPPTWSSSVDMYTEVSRHRELNRKRRIAIKSKRRKAIIL